MSVCRYYLNGNCRFGDNCYNFHPGDSDSGPRYSKKGDYYISQDKRSLFRSEPHHHDHEAVSDVSFSFNRALQKQTQNTNRFGILSEIDMEEVPGVDYETSLFTRSKEKSSFSFKVDNQMKSQLFGQATSQSGSSSFNLSHLSGQGSNKYGLFRPRSNPEGFSIMNQNQFGNTTNTLQFNEQSMDDSGTSIFANPPQSLFGKPLLDNKEREKYSEDDGKLNLILRESSWLNKIMQEVYSKMEDLNDLEKNYFTANTFKHDEIPLRPPPKVLCT